MRKTVATCDCCSSLATEEVNLEGGHTLDFCDACVMSPPAMTVVLRVCNEIRARRSYEGIALAENRLAQGQGRIR